MEGGRKADVKYLREASGEESWRQWRVQRVAFRAEGPQDCENHDFTWGFLPLKPLAKLANFI